MRDEILSALNSLNASELNYNEWLNVGMALKHEGFDVGEWDAWSKADARYKAGECLRKWDSFKGSASPVTGGTIISLARERGWTNPDDCLDWDSVISEGGEVTANIEKTEMTPVEELKCYIKTLFHDDECVGYVTNSVFNMGGRFMPGKGRFDRTAGEILESLEQYPNDLGATVGDWKSDAGAWIRINPLDGRGVKNENVVAFRYALVESDEMPIEEQESFYRRLKLPIATLVYSGGRSLHAAVKVDAKDETEYRIRVNKLYTFIESKGVRVDKQNRNPSRLSRMPGVTRKGVRQRLLATNIGFATWEEWEEYVDCASDGLPELENLRPLADNPPEVPEELISGILRKGHKMLISGASKAGKSFLLMELCIAIAEGGEWLGFKCKQGKVMYINLEIDRASCVDRFLKIYKANRIEKPHFENISVWNLRGMAKPLEKLVPSIVRRIKDQDYCAVIIDPIYKVITGDENSAGDMGAFCNQFDRICALGNTAVIYSHHHSKGTQGHKRVMDRASGSGVFARDPDAQLDIIELELDETTRALHGESGASAWRMESSLREFRNIKPVNFWFKYPLHILDKNDALRSLKSQGQPKISEQSPKKESINASCVRMAYDCQNMDATGVELTALSNFLGVSERTVRRWLKTAGTDYAIVNGKVKRLEVIE